MAKAAEAASTKSPGQAQAQDITSDQHPILAAALAYAEQGRVPVPVCWDDPCQIPWHLTDGPCGGKRPLVKIKDRDAVTPDQLRQWWRRWPNADVAVLTGARSNMVVFDIDGPEGEASFAKLDETHGPFPPTLEVRTRHGRHLYFADPNGEVLTRRSEYFHPWGRDNGHGPATGLDVRGEGGLVVVPPSRDRTYVNDLALAEVPVKVVGPISTKTGAPAKEKTQAKEKLLEQVKGQLVLAGKGTRRFTFTEAMDAIEKHCFVKLLEHDKGRNRACWEAGRYAGHHAGPLPMFWTREEIADIIAAAAEGVGLEREDALRQILNGIDDSEGDWTAEHVWDTGPAEDQEQKDKRTQAILDAALDATELDSLPEPVPLLGRLLNREEYTIVVGKFGTYKSFLCLAWGFCIATGREWCGHEVPEPLPVVYVAAEGVTGIRKRLRALERHHGLIVPKGMLTVIRRPVHLANDEEVAGLRQVVEQRQAKLVILDTWHRMTPGIEENSATETGGPLDKVLALRDDFGANVLIAHHTGHQQLHGRGSSSIEDDADASWIVRLGKSDDAEDRSRGTPRTLVHRKSKDGELVDPVQLQLLVDDQGGAVVEAAPFVLVSGKPGRPSKAVEHEAAVLELIREMDEAGLDLDQGERKVMDWDAARRPGRAASRAAVREAVSARRGRAGREVAENFNVTAPEMRRPLEGVAAHSGPRSAPETPPEEFSARAEQGKQAAERGAPKTPPRVSGEGAPKTPPGVSGAPCSECAGPAKLVHVGIGRQVWCGDQDGCGHRQDLPSEWSTSSDEAAMWEAGP